MIDDEDRVRDFAQRYAEAWCSHDPTRVAAHFAPAGTIAVNGAAPTPAVGVARGFISAFPDIQVFMDDVIFKDDTVEFHWTFTGTNTGPGGTGKSVRISGFEEWTFGEDGLVTASKGHYDQAAYDRQLVQGAPE
jgi:SnoaL-like domain